MDFIEQVGTRYLEGKANAAPKQLEDFAKKQFFDSPKEGSKAKSRKGSVSPKGEDRGHGEHGEEDEHEEHGRTSTKSGGKGKLDHDLTSEKDLEIARLRGELEESRRAARKTSRTPSKKKDEHKAPAKKESPARQLRKSRSTKVFDNKGIKVVGGALVADAASRRHREKRPEHNATREIGKTIDGKGLGLAGGALVAGRGSKARSKSEHAAKEPIIVEAAPRPRPRERSWYEVKDDDKEDDDGGSGYGNVAHSTHSRRRRPTKQRSHEEDEHEHGSDHGSVAHSIVSQRMRKPSLEDTYSEHGSITPSPASHSGRHSFADHSDHHSIAPSRASTRRRSSPTSRSEVSSIPAPPPPPSRRKSILSSRPRRPSTESSLGSVIAPPAQVEAIRRRQRSRGRGLTDAEIDTPAPETPSLRALSGRRREMETRHERGGWGEREEEEAVHLPERRKSVLHERVRGEEGGSVIDVLEARSVPFRPHRERDERGRYEEGKERERARQRQREMDIVEVVEEKARQRGGPVARRIERGEPVDGRRSEVELMRREGGRTVYRVR